MKLFKKLFKKRKSHHCIVMGENLKVENCSYRLLIDFEGIKIDRIMKKSEYKLFMRLLKNINLAVPSVNFETDFVLQKCFAKTIEDFYKNK